MRTFILKATEAPTSAELINLDDLKASGRIDLVCRCVSNALFVANHIRPDTIINVVLEGPPLSTRVISFAGNKIRQIEYDEKSIAAVIKLALEKGKDLEKDNAADVEQGIRISRNTFTEFVSQFAGKTLFYLHKKGEDIRDVKFKTAGDKVFILGDHKGLDKQDERLMKRLAAKKISLSPMMLYSSHCIVIVQNELDRQC